MNNVIWSSVVRIAFEASLQSAALALCVGGILVAARIRSGAVRHAAWLAVLCGMMLMPLLPRITPQVQIPISLPAIADADAQVTNQMVLSPQGQATTVRSLALPRNYGTAPDSSQNHITWSAIGVAVYAAGLLFLLGCLVPGWRLASQIARSGVSVQAPIAGADVRESPLVNTPLTVGIFSPRIILPPGWREWSDTKLRAVLAHEAAHVKNRDALVNLAAHLNRCIFWFHPLAWWLEKKLSITAEHASDEAGARAVGDSKEYASVLLDVAAVIGPRRRRYALVSAGMRGDGGLEERIDRILRGEAVHVVSRARKATVAVTCAIAIFAIPACRQASVTGNLKKQEIIPEVKALLSTRARPADPEFRSKVDEVRAKLGQSNDVELLAANGQALVKRFSPVLAIRGINLGGEANEAGRVAVARALKLDPGSQAAHEAQVSAEASLLMSARWNPADPEARKRLAYIAGELGQSTDVNFLISTATPMVSMTWPTDAGPAAASEVFAVGKAAIQRALQLEPNSVWARQLMVKVRDQELVARLPENIWGGPLDSRHQAIQALPAGERFREMSILAASAGDSAIRAMRDPAAERELWHVAGTYATEALNIAPQAKDDPDYGISLFRADMVAASAALLAGNKTAAVGFAAQAMDAPPAEALRYPIVNARPWSNWHYPQILVAQFLRNGDRDAAADIVERYSHVVIAGKDLWVATLATIRSGGTPPWAQMY